MLSAFPVAIMVLSIFQYGLSKAAITAQRLFAHTQPHLRRNGQLQKIWTVKSLLDLT